MAYSGVIAAIIYKLLCRNRVIVDTGDSIYALAKSMGTRNRLHLWLTRMLEACSLFFADRIVVRGTAHKHMLAARGVRAVVIQDGVETDLFCPMDVADLRRRYNLNGVVTMGLLGSITWSPKLQTCYGVELIEVLNILRDLPLKGIIIGDGSGLEILKAKAAAYGLTDRIEFVGRVPYCDLPPYLNLIDICISTQTNDEVGQVRTTGKLPLYLASGKYVIATRVGEAALVLPERMLIDFNGTNDPDYVQRLADRIRSVCKAGRLSACAESTRAIAIEHFEYRLLSCRLSEVLAILTQ